jgi:hypothetical protein
VLVVEAGWHCFVVLIGAIVVSVGHVMIVKRFETEIETGIEIKDSQLYASRYNDD